MANINDAFPSKYLKASDIEGATPIVTLDHVAFEPVGRNREMKAVLYFRGKEKGLVLNKTNAVKLTELTGSAETNDWAGARVMLYTSETQFGGETFESVRIKPVGPSAPVLPRDPEPPRRQVADAPSEMLTDHDIPF